MKLRSMTGFARVRRTILDLDIVFSLKSVNHRGLDLHFYTGPELDPFEAIIRSRVKQHIARGHVDIRAQVTRPDAAGALALDEAKLTAYVAAFRQAAKQFQIVAQPDLNLALRVPGILMDSAALNVGAEMEAPLLDVVDEVMETLNQFRSREGAELGAFMLERNASVRAATAEMQQLRKDVQPYFQSRLHERLKPLLSGSAIDPQRLLQEAAILADKSDIGEELERLQIHSRQLDEILHNESEAGKKLDFVLQEMNRETNTILSKTSGVGGGGIRITELALSVKSDVEKLREQVLNLE